MLTFLLIQISIYHIRPIPARIAADTPAVAEDARHKPWHDLESCHGYGRWLAKGYPPPLHSGG
ncbi:MAG: hypothetical protein JSU09_04770 [Bacteroidetes bacterium]|nr:hypothetical protein [Bacteroidota bacterium]